MGRVVFLLLFSPVIVGLLLFFGAMAVWKLPMLWCQRQRAVRWLPLAGLCYSAAATLAAAILGLVWWEVMLLVGVLVLGGEWLLPNPVAFVFRPAQRRAARRAIEFVEQGGGPRAVYGRVRVIGSEPNRLVVSVDVDTGTKPSGRRFIAVGRDGTAEELDFAYVAATYGIGLRR